MRAVSLIHNEQTKLTATFFNSLATTLVAAGGFAPLAAMAYGISALHIEGSYVAVLVVVCAVIGGSLHWVGRRILGSLRE
jgi:hypothetical protein